MNSLKYFLFLTYLCSAVLCANILSLFPMPSMSHVRLGLELSKELAARGHNITMLTPYPQGINKPNFREISQAELTELMKGKI